MASFREIGEQYAKDLRDAIERDGFLEKSAAVIKESARRSHLASELRRIGQELDSVWRIQDRPLTQEQKELILERAAIELGVEPQSLALATKAAQNDAHIDMITNIGEIVDQLKEDQD